MRTLSNYLKKLLLLTALVTSGAACHSLTECQKFFSVPSEALQCQRGADEVAQVVKRQFAVLPTPEQAEPFCRSHCADDLGGYSGSVDGTMAAELIDLQVACVRGCVGRIFYDGRVQRGVAEGCDMIRVGGSIRCI
jgi:hypothetical protein